MKKVEESILLMIDKIDIFEIMEGKAGKHAKSFPQKLLLDLVLPPLTWVIMMILGLILLTYVISGFGMYFVVQGFKDGDYVFPSIILGFNLLFLISYIVYLKKEYDKENNVN